MSNPDADIRRLERYSSATSEYLIAIITDKDRASQVELGDGQIAWESTLRYDRLQEDILIGHYKCEGIEIL